MRSLTLLDLVSHPVVGSSSSSSSSSSTSTSLSSVAAVTLDAATQTLYVVAETATPDSCSELCIYRLENGRQSHEPPQPLTSWTTDLISPLPNIPLVVAFRYLPESDSLVLVLSNGHVEQISDPSGAMAAGAMRENVGTFDSGIKAAAWAPDEELLALVTGDDLLLSITATFDVLSEGPLTTTSFGVDAPVNVGWGDKSTQFHGSLGKSAAQQPSLTPTQTLASPNDDDRIRISWRGDSAWFSVSKFERTPTGDTRRVLRIYSRLGGLSSTGEACMGMEGGLSWQPSGSLIAANQREGPQQKVVFFERNGLRRYEFALREEREGATVKELSWNSESNLLGVWLRKEGGDVVQLWNRNNYCWTLKQELAPRSRITSLFWHPEEPLSLYLTTSTGIEHFSLAWDTFISSREAPKDSGSVAVVDGATLKLTPFRLVNIPPPMAAIVLTLGSDITKTPVHVAFAKQENGFVVLFDDGLVQSWAWELNLKTMRYKPRNEIKEPVLDWSVKIDGEGYCKQCAVMGKGDQKKVAVLRCTGRGGTEVVLLRKEAKQEVIRVEEGAWRIEGTEDGFVLESKDGTLFEVSSQATSDDILLPSDDLMPLAEFCPDIRTLTLSTTRIVLGLSLSGRLYSNSRLLASDATSFICTHNFLIYTTFTHEAKFIPLFSLESGQQNDFVTHVENVRKSASNEQESTNSVKNGGMGIRRAVERGSRIVTVVESSTTLVLQMPRGNLETICPRPLVLRIVRQELDRGHYRTAFLTCRRHRIDLNILYDHNPTTFRAHLPDFVSQVKEVDYLNLFLSGLKDEDVTKTMYKSLMILGPKPSTSTTVVTEGDDGVVEGKVNEVCNLVREELEKKDVFEYANSVLTAYVRKKPADYEAALRVLVELKAKDSERAQDAVKYIIFLSDANKLYDLALGMYDFSLVLLVAQESQKDPREYLPFLRELRQLDTYLQRHRIDDHLERYDSALRNLAKAGEGRFEEVLEYTKRHGLFGTALEAYKGDAGRYRVVVEANADYLMENRKYAEAGLLCLHVCIVYSIASQPSKAIVAYQSANAWQELFTIALSSASPEMPKKSASEIKALAMEVAESLRGKRRFSEAGRVLLEYGRDLEAAVQVLIEGNEFAECLRICSLYNRRDLIETHVKASTLEAQSKLIDDFGELKEQIEKQVERLDELKKRRDANPNQFFCIDDPSGGPDDIDVQPDGESDAGTAFTRYTAAAPTTLGGGSRISSTRSSRSKRRAGLKKAAGKKGSIYEETYLLNSFKKSVETRLAELQTETGALLSALLLLHSTTHRSAAAALQAELASLEDAFRTSLDHLWSWREKEWATEKHEELRLKARGEWVEKPKPEEGTEKVERPKMAREKWRIGLLEVL
ncbi:BZ3500_MvSof-1268-A1-R1_Chr1-1g01107 [Microbotryum saponariae]|uniref:Elongator complex protein 1 n=1 Tax=Microbotryum saponariae TaxID=289078 RepID=A0A2X0KIE5_9BASI|nr:BZ3500_MvSof-1268-A1-R1_Chr1-1g01107 [Microbotryum saponariae]SCZ93392.1 BZ3501_MvSof-1269-A2-R1_Chr1-1g00704 [Microbotryum saponariae]